MIDKDKPMSAVEAIQRIEDHIRVHRMGEWPHIRLGIALNKAIVALREKAAREATECEYCQGDEALLDVPDEGVSLFVDSDGNMDLFAGRRVECLVAVRFCPMCGRRLTPNEDQQS